MRAVFQNNLKHRPFFGPHSAGHRIGARLRTAPRRTSGGRSPFTLRLDYIDLVRNGIERRLCRSGYDKTVRKGAIQWRVCWGRYAQTSNAADGVERWASEALNKGRLAHLGVEMDAIQKSIASLAAEALTARNIGRGDAEGKLVELGKSDAILSPSHHS